MNIEIKDGAILKDGVEIGKYLADSNTMLAVRQLAPREKGAINKLLGTETPPAYDILPENKPKEDVPATKAQNDAKLVPITLSERYPDAPAIDPEAGDKTPAFVDWLTTHHPKDAEERYRGRKVNGVLR